MKKIIFYLFFAFCLLSSIKADTFIETNYINRGVWDSRDMFGPFISDYNKNGKDELVISSTAQVVLFYEYNSGFNLLDSIPFDTNYEYMIPVGISDLDTDGLSEITLIKTGSNRLWVYEQSESTSFFDSLVWQSDTVYKSICHVGVTNRLKGDGIDRIYGGGIPWLTTTTKSYGWYYFTCTGDNQYEILNTFEESTQIQSAMDIGDIDNDSLTEVVLESYLKTQIYKYESISADDDSFEFTDSLMTYASPLCLLILPDLDRDGINEVSELLLNYGGYPTSYKCIIFEGTDTIFNRDFEVETDNMVLFAGDIDYGDVDGDSIEEVVFCGGRHLEVWESTGDNQFEMLWEYTDPTYNTIQSHIKCHDFNKNGYDEIIFSGVGSSLGEEHTRIFEMKRWSMEGETLVIGNSEEGDTIRKDLVIRNESDGEINIDSMKISSAYFGLTTMTWPLTINGNDSTEVEVWFKGDSMGRYFDSMEVYADKSMYKEYMRAGNELELMLDSIKAFDGMNPISGIDEDDIVVFFFGSGTNKPDINAGNIDSILRLSGGDEWDIAGEGIELTKWLSYPGGDRFYVYFDASGKIPTVKVGDTVYTDSQTVIGTWCGERWKRPVVITGSFGPTGTEERHEPWALGIWDSTCTVPTIKNQYIIWNTNAEATLSIYDISGREVIREESKTTGEHKTDIGHLKNGIYFIKLNTDKQSITEKMVRIR